MRQFDAISSTGPTRETPAVGMVGDGFDAMIQSTSNPRSESSELSKLG